MLGRLGPGVIIAGSIVGSGELIATTKTGAEAGFWLLWLIIVGCTIKVFAQVELGRHTITWSQTPLRALNAVPGPRLKVNWLIWYWAFQTVLIISQQGGIVGGVGQTLAIQWPLTDRGTEYNRVQDELIKARVELAMLEKSDPASARIDELRQRTESLTKEIGGIREPGDAYLWALLIAVATSGLLCVGRYGLIQVVSTVLVATFTFVTVLTVVMLQTKPQWAVSGQELWTGLSFRLPPVVEGLARNPVATALAAFGIIGVGSSEMIMYPYWCLEKGYARHTGPRDGTPQWAERARGWLRVLQVDAWTSLVVYTFATVAFYLLGAAVLGRVGLNPKGADMVRTLSEMYVPVMGKWAPPVFALGAFAVLYSTFFVAAAGHGRMVADGMGLFGLTDGSDAGRRKWAQIISVVWPLVAVGLYWWMRAPVAMVLASGTCQAIMLPLLGIAVLHFRYRHSDPVLKSGRLWDMMLWLSLAGFLVVGLWSLYSLFFGS